MARWFVDRLPQKGIPSVSLRRLLPEARFLGCPDWDVSGCTDDHRRLDPGQVFVAVHDAHNHYDGHLFVREALERGAAGVVLERPCPEAGRLQVVVNDSRAAHAKICQALAGDPSQQLATVGVGGTYGKTVTSLLVRSILEAAGHRCGLVGGMGWFDGSASRPLGGNSRGHAKGAWPGGAAGLATILAYMVDQDCTAGVLEVSREAIAGRCLEGMTFQVAVATDLGLPHGLPAGLANDGRRALAKLFQKIRPGGAAIVNADDPMVEVLGGVNLDARRVSYGLNRPSDVDVSATIERLDSSGSRFLLHGFDRTLPVHLRLIGPKQVSHAVAAAAVALAMEIDLDAVVAGLENVANIAGHLEAVEEGQEFEVRIDAALTATPLAQALGALRAISSGRVHCVLSAEGGQDRETRRAVAEIAERLSDRVILTLGNPRTEDPGHLMHDLLGGFRRPGRVRVEPDRRRAIEVALGDARPGDAVLIAGKGRNAYQIHAEHVVPFDDFAIARDWLRQNGAGLTTRQRSA